VRSLFLGTAVTADKAADRIVPFGVALFVAAAIVALFAVYSVTKVTLVIALGPLLIAVLSFSFELTMMAFIALLFSTQDAGVVKVVVPFAAVVSASFVISHRDVHVKDFATPITGGLVWFLATMAPSLLNTPDIVHTLAYLQNPAAIALIMLTLGASISSSRDCTRYLGAFVALATVNSLAVIVLGAMSGRREVGFSGLVFVDYVAVLLLLALNDALFHKRTRRLLGAIVAAVAATAMLLTQTRNTLISVGICLVIYAGYLFKNNHLIGVSRRRLSVGAIVLVVLALFLLLGVTVYFPHAFTRIAELGQTSRYEVRTVEDFSINSMVTRLLVWMTAWQAFLAHPLLGIGAYSFPFASAEYFTLPPSLYLRYVQGLSPHVTYLASLAETGIVGLTGFLVFLGSSLRTATRAVRLSKVGEERFVSTSIFVVQLYIAVSMTMTDAWLWGQCGMLWALILGLNAGNYLALVRAHE
jgi:O-antigen ligase